MTGLDDARHFYQIDGHTHLTKSDPEAGARLLERSRRVGIDKVALLALGEMKFANQNSAALVAKAKHPNDIFLLGALDYSALATEVDHRYTFPFGKQIKRLYEMGCDGIKMLNGKPNVRRDAGIAIDSPLYDGLFARFEELGMPLLWHVNDPEEFWDPKEAPEWASRAGWTYDEKFPSKEQIYEETERVLAARPKLRVIFAHFYFLSADLPRAGEFLERFPNVSIDLAPGIEMFHNFSANIDAARDFFIKYQDRIIFGTDLVETSPLGLTETVRKCLESNDEWHITTEPNLFWPDHRTTLRGLSLPDDVLKKIGGENFFRLFGRAPRPLVLDKVQEELERLARIARETGISEEGALKTAEEWLRGVIGE